MPMTTLLNQIENSVENHSYMIGLYSSLTIPDICGALESENGYATGQKYKAWFDAWVSQKYGGWFTGEQCYAFRNGVVHQGRANHQNLGYERIIFVEPGHGLTAHNNIMNDAFNIDVGQFCTDMVESARDWIKATEHTDNFQRNIVHLLQRHDNGLPPYIVGLPVYG